MPENFRTPPNVVEPDNVSKLMFVDPEPDNVSKLMFVDPEIPEVRMAEVDPRATSSGSDLQPPAPTAPRLSWSAPLKTPPGMEKMLPYMGDVWVIGAGVGNGAISVCPFTMECTLPYPFGYQTGRRTGLVLWAKTSLSGKGLGQGFLNVADMMVLVVFLDSIVFQRKTVRPVSETGGTGLCKLNRPDHFGTLWSTLLHLPPKPTFARSLQHARHHTPCTLTNHTHIHRLCFPCPLGCLNDA